MKSRLLINKDAHNYTLVCSWGCKHSGWLVDGDAIRANSSASLRSTVRVEHSLTRIQRDAGCKILPRRPMVCVIEGTSCFL